MDQGYQNMPGCQAYFLATRVRYVQDIVILHVFKVRFYKLVHILSFHGQKWIITVFTRLKLLHFNFPDPEFQIRIRIN